MLLLTYSKGIAGPEPKELVAPGTAVFFSNVWCCGCMNTAGCEPSLVGAVKEEAWKSRMKGRAIRGMLQNRWPMSMHGQCEMWICIHVQGYISTCRWLAQNSSSKSWAWLALPRERWKKKTEIEATTIIIECGVWKRVIVSSEQKSPREVK